MIMYKIGKFSELTGISVPTLRYWDKKGLLKPEFVTPGGTRMYSEAQLHQIIKNELQNKEVDVYSDSMEQYESVTANEDTTINKKCIPSKDATPNESVTTNKSVKSKQPNQNKSQNLQNGQNPPRINIGYARVSTKEQEEELKKQVDFLELFLIKQGKPFKIISDIGSGIDHTKPGLRELIQLISTNQVDTVYVLYKDRLVRFGFKLIEECAKHHDTKIEVINQTEEKIDEDEFMEDVVYIINVFSYIFSYKSNGNKDIIINKIAQRLLDGKERE